MGINTFWSIAVVCAFGAGFLAGYYTLKTRISHEARAEELVNSMEEVK